MNTPAIQQKKKPPLFVTFYSFKGGVGRTMALMNVGCLLAAHGRKVMLIDMDLEAPGLTWLASPLGSEKSPQKGFVDMLFDFYQDNEVLAITPENQKPLLKYSYDYYLAENFTPKPHSEGKLRIMPAGAMMQEKAYHERAGIMNLGKLYMDGRGFPTILNFRRLIERSEDFDYVLIDSRTGFSDEAAVCLRDLGNDGAVMLLGLNHQNVNGLAQFLAYLKHQQIKPKRALFVASPVPLSDQVLRRQRIAVANQLLSENWWHKIKIEHEIGYHPMFALDEKPDKFYWWDENILFDAYSQIEEQIREWRGDTKSAVYKKIREAEKTKNHDTLIAAIHKLEFFDEAETANEFLEQGMNISHKNYLLSLQFFMEANIIAERYGDKKLIMEAYDWLGINHYWLSNYQEADQFLLQSLKLAEELGEELWKYRIKLYQGLILVETGESAQALKVYLECLDYYKNQDDQADILFALNAIGTIKRRQGDFKAALEYYQESSEISKKLQYESLFALSRYGIACVKVLKGEYKSALSLFNEALVIYKELEEKNGISDVNYWLGEVYRRQGAHGKAMRFYQDSLMLAQEMGKKSELSFMQIRMAFIYREKKEFEQAEQLLNQSLNTASALGMPRDLGLAQLEMGRLRNDQGRDQEAMEFYQKCLAIFEKIGLKLEIIETQQAIAELKKSKTVKKEVG